MFAHSPSSWSSEALSSCRLSDSCIRKTSRNVNTEHPSLVRFNGVAEAVNSREVLPERADEMSSKHTPQRQTATVPRHHHNTAVRRPADHLHSTRLIPDICHESRNHTQTDWIMGNTLVVLYLYYQWTQTNQQSSNNLEFSKKSLNMSGTQFQPKTSYLSTIQTVWSREKEDIIHLYNSTSWNLTVTGVISVHQVNARKAASHGSTHQMCVRCSCSHSSHQGASEDHNTTLNQRGLWVWGQTY